MRRQSLVQAIQVLARGEDSEDISERFGARIYKKYGIFVCVISWPEELQDLVLGIARPFRRSEGSDHSLEMLGRFMPLDLPPEAQNFSAADQWFRTHFGSVAELLPPNWHLYTRRGTPLLMRQALDEPVLVILPSTDDDWVNGAECLYSYLAALNQSPLCEAGTARYLGDGSIEVRLSQAGLAEGQEKLVLELAQLYDK